MSERKFTRGLHKPGSAAQVRETVSQAVRDSTISGKLHLVEPVDFETFSLKNRTILQNDPLREILLFPQEDFMNVSIPRVHRTVDSSVPAFEDNSVSSLFSRMCIKSYTENWCMVDYKYKVYSGSYLLLPKLPKTNELEDLVYEVDAETENEKLCANSVQSGIIKEGFILKGPESGNDSFISLATKSFKRRFVCLRQEVDGTYMLEFHKDNRKNEPKGALCMDFCSNVARNSRRGKLGFEVKMSEGHKTCVLAAENEQELQSWINILSNVVSSSKSSGDNRKSLLSLDESSESGISTLSSSTGYSTLKGLEHSKNPELAKYARESDYSIAQARKENRQNLFAIYPDMQVTPPSYTTINIQREVKPLKEEFGKRLFVKCEEVKFRLQAPLEHEKGALCQVEPYITFLSIFDAQKGCKVTEEFRFDVNHPYIRNMLPWRSKKNSLSNSNSSGVSTESGSVHIKNIGEEWMLFPKQAIFTVNHPSSDLFFVLRIEKVLQGSISQASEPYLRQHSTSYNGRLGMKVQKSVRAFCQHLGHYRMPFAWAARPIFKPISGELDYSLDFGPIYRQENSKLSDDDMIRYLQDFRKPDKLKHLTVIPGTIKLTIELFQEMPKNCLTSSMMPLLPFPVPPVAEPTLEVELFPSETASDSCPFTIYLNHLYVFPKSLKYDGQKSFPKARNILCTIEFRDNDGASAQPLPVIYGRPGESLYTTEASTSITHHNLNPDFYEEVKILLPLQLHEKHHLLFTFHHVSCELPKGTKRKDIPVSSIVGFSWLPLISKGRITVDDQLLPVSVSLPSGYLSSKPLGLGKGYSGPEIRWVDSGKELFKVVFKLVSTVQTKDQHLHNFFFNCQRLLETRIPTSDYETKDGIPLPVGAETVKEFSKFIKALHAVDLSTIIHFLPTILNQLFYLIVLIPEEEISSNVVRVLIHIVHGIHDARKNDIIHSYVQYVFDTTRMYVCNRIVHEELIKCMIALLDLASTDFLVINKFLQHSWFFFQIITKSMAQHLLASERIKMLRNERFPTDFQCNIQRFIEEFVPHIFSKHKELPAETRQANLSLALFIKQCLSLMDRGFVFQLVSSYLEKFSPADTKDLHEYKFEFLDVVCSHEHFIPLNLPLMRGIFCRGSAKNSKDIDQEYHLSEEYCKYHFLVGVLLTEVKMSFYESQNIRRTAISVLRNLLAKHSFDDRYQGKLLQARIASLYLPFIAILLENFRSLYGKAVAVPTPPPVTKHKATSSSPLINAMKNSDNVNHLNLTTFELTASLPHSARNRDSNYLSAIAGQSQPQHVVTFANGSTTSVNSSLSNSLTVSFHSHESDGFAPRDGTDSLDGFKCHARSQSLPFPGSSSLLNLDKQDRNEIRDVLVCFLHIIKNVNEDLLVTWWRRSSESDLLEFLQILELCLHQFKYMGKKNIRTQHPVMLQPKSMTLPARTPPPSFVGRCNSTYSESSGVSPSSSTCEADAFYRALLEANMATEVGLIALDMLGLITLHLKDQLLLDDGDNPLMKKIFDIYISFLQVGQSEKLLHHLFAAMRAFIKKFPVALFQGNAVLCGKLCFELLRCCNSKLHTVRSEACALLYLLMRSNFEFSGQKEITRVHLQLIVSVSRLLGDVVNLNNARLQESLSVINTFASSDKVMHNTAFPSEVKDLAKRIRTVLMATMQMKEHENDPEMLVDLQHKLANSYASTPALRKTWLECMAKNHLKNQDFSEAAYCFIHIAAVEAEYLKQKGLFSDGCSAFENISPNITKDESEMKDDSGIHDVQYSENTFLKRLEQCVKLLDQAERYEVIADVYKLIIPIYEKRRDYKALSECYKILHLAFAKIVDVSKSGRRLLGKYFRVAFFGQAYFDDDEHTKEYIYKEPKVTSLAEISERLHFLFCEKFGKESVKMIMDSNQVNTSDLDPKFAYIQVTHVVPYFNDHELIQRPTEFERNHNLKRFMFETPFTKGNSKARGLPEEQCKRRTVLTTEYAFPYVKKRIPVCSKTLQVFSPIEVALDEMHSRVSELREVVSLQPTDLKKLQLKLQGSISVQVNAGPLAYAEAFLDSNKVDKYDPEMVMALKEIYRIFINVCQDALDLNGKLVTSDQYEYHSSLKQNFDQFVNSLTDMLKEERVSISSQGSQISKRTSLEVFSYISGSSSSSTA